MLKMLAFTLLKMEKKTSPAWLEHATYCLGNNCSIQLSYGDMINSKITTHLLESKMSKLFTLVLHSVLAKEEATGT